MGVPGHFPFLWLCWPSRMHIYCSVCPFNEGTRTLFSPYGGTHDEAPKRKNVVRWPSR